MKSDQERLAWLENLLTKECSMEGMWEEFSKAVLGNMVPPLQNEMRKAFYAGGICLFDLINFMGKQHADATMMTKLMSSLRAEFTKFSEEQIRGTHYRKDSEVSGHGRPH